MFVDGGEFWVDGVGRISNSEAEFPGKSFAGY